MATKTTDSVTRTSGGSYGSPNWNPGAGAKNAQVGGHTVVVSGNKVIGATSTAAQQSAQAVIDKNIQQQGIQLDQAVLVEQERLREKYGDSYQPSALGQENIARNIVMYGTPISPSNRSPEDLATYKAYTGPDISTGMKNIAQNQQAGYLAQDKTGMYATSAGPSPFSNMADVATLHERTRVQFGGGMAGEIKVDTDAEREAAIKYGGSRLFDRLASRDAPKYDFSGVRKIQEAKDTGVLEKSFDIGKTREGEQYGLSYTGPTVGELDKAIKAEAESKFVTGLIEKNKDNPENLRLLEAHGLITLKRDEKEEARVQGLIEQYKDNPEKLKELEKAGLIKLSYTERSPEEKARIERMIEENKDNPDKLKEMERLGLITMAAPMAVGGAGVGGVGGAGVGGETQTLTKVSKTSEYAGTAYSGGAMFFAATGPLQTAAIKSKSWTGLGINVGTFVTGAVSMVAGKLSGEGYQWMMPKALESTKKVVGELGSRAENLYNFGFNKQIDFAKSLGADSEQFGLQKRAYVTPESSSWAKTLTEPAQVAVGFGPATPALAPMYAMSKGMDAAQPYIKAAADRVAPAPEKPEPLGIVKSGVSAAENLSLAVARKFEAATGWTVTDKERQPVNAETSTWLLGMKEYAAEQQKPVQKTVEERIIGIGRPAVELGATVMAAEYVGARIIPTATSGILNQKLSLSVSTPRTASTEGLIVKAGQTPVDDLTVLSIRKGAEAPNIKLGIGWKTLNQREAGWVEAGGKDFIPAKTAPVGADKYLKIDKASGQTSSYQWEKAKPRMWGDDTKVSYPNLVTRGSKLKAEFASPKDMRVEIANNKGLTVRSTPQMERQFVDSSEAMTRMMMTQEYPQKMMAKEVDFSKTIRVFEGEQRAGAAITDYMRKNPELSGFGGPSRVAHKVSESTADIDQLITTNPRFAKPSSQVATEEANALSKVSNKFAVSKENPSLVVRTDIKQQPHALDIHGPDSPLIQEGIKLDPEYFMGGFPIAHDSTQVGGVSFRKLFIEGQALHGAATMPEIQRLTPFTPEETLFWKRDLKTAYESMGGKYGPIGHRLKDVTNKYDVQGGLNRAGEEMGNPQAKAAEAQRQQYAEAADYKFRGAKDATGKTYKGLTSEQVKSFYGGLKPKPTVGMPTIYVTSAVAPPSMYVSPSIGSPYSSSLSPSTSSLIRSMSPSVSPSRSVSPSIYASPSPSVSPSPSPSRSPYPSPSVSPYLIPSPSVSPSRSSSPSPSPPSPSPSPSPSEVPYQRSGFSQLGGFSSGGGGQGKQGRTTGDRYSIRNPWRTAESFKEKVIGGRRRF